jgi:hypothetical protein
MRTPLQRLAIVGVLLTFAGLAGMAPHSAGAVSQQISARTTVGEFYTWLDAKDFGTAYSLLSPNFQASHPFAGWMAGYATTDVVGYDTAATDDPATVWVYLTAIDTTNQVPLEVTRYSGYWHLVPGLDGVGWLLDSADIATDAEPTAYATPAIDFSLFAGSWTRHGFSLDVDASGAGTASWRTYRFCSDGPPPCDTFAGNTIVDGGQGSLAFSGVFGSSAVGGVAGSTDPSGLNPAVPVSFTLLPFDMAVLVQSDGHVLIFCGAQLTADRPQAVQNLCGA